MRARIIEALLVLALIPSAALAQGGFGQVTFDNQTGAAADMYVDGAYQCRALARLSCTARVEVGMHFAEFRFDDGNSVGTELFSVDEGEAVTIPITEQTARNVPHDGVRVPAFASNP